MLLSNVLLPTQSSTQTHFFAGLYFSQKIIIYKKKTICISYRKLKDNERFLHFFAIISFYTMELFEKRTWIKCVLKCTFFHLNTVKGNIHFSNLFCLQQKFPFHELQLKKGIQRLKVMLSIANSLNTSTLLCAFSHSLSVSIFQSFGLPQAP